MCFRPPEAGTGEIVCKSCYTITAPNPDGTCPECGEPMGAPAATAPGAPAAPAAPKVPAAPSVPGAFKPPSA